MATTKLRIPVAHLLAKVQAAATEDTQRTKEAVREWETKMQAYRRALVSALRAEAHRISKGGKLDYRGARDVSSGLAWPGNRPERSARIIQDLASLKATDQPHILVDPSGHLDHWARYL